MKVNDLTRTLLAIRREDRVMKALGFRRQPSYWRPPSASADKPVEIRLGLHGMTYTRFR